MKSMHRHLYPTIPHRWLYLPDTYILYPPYFFLKMVLTGGLTSVHGVNGVSLLEIAASTGSLEMVEMIVEKTNNINATSDEGRNALFGAVYSNNCEIIEFLVRKGIEINKETIDGMLTPLLFAVSLQNVAAAEKLIELGADITIMNNEGYDAKRLANKLGLSIRGLNTSTSN